MKHFYIAISIKENEKYYAYVLKVSENDNLLSKLNIKNIITANICSTRKQARETVEAWRAAYIANNTHMF